MPRKSSKSATARKPSSPRQRPATKAVHKTVVQGKTPQRVLAVRGARTHNLKNVSIDIAHNQITVLTGVSGSGKSSLALDTIYAEGQRQYIESLSTYARQFLNQLERADVDSIEGLQPTLCIDQRVGIANPRSTVATVTEVYDFLRLMMARVGVPNCFSCGAEIQQCSATDILAQVMAHPEGTKLVLMAPVVRGRKGTHRDVFAEIQKAGLVRVRVDGELFDVDATPELALRKNHTIEAVVDRVVIRPSSQQRLQDSIDVALELASGVVSISYQLPKDKAADLWQDDVYSTLYSCAACGASFEEIEPRTFSFNSPHGACPACDGMGQLSQFDGSLIVKDWAAAKASDAIELLRGAAAAVKRPVKRFLEKHLASQDLAWTKPLQLKTAKQRERFLTDSQSGLNPALELFFQQADTDTQEWLNEFRAALPCPACDGARLRPEALAVQVDNKTIHDINEMSLSDALPWLESLEFSETKALIAAPILAEMLHRLRFLNKVGVGYLTLGRPADTLSGGELQRVRLATCIGSGLVGVTYILDEPSIGLHQRDNDRLIDSMRDLKANGNTVLVVEHDEAMMRAADSLVDIGPGAGHHGGEIVVHAAPEIVAKHPESLTAAYLRGDRTVTSERELRRPKKSRQIRLTGASLHNLKNVTLDLPLGLLVGVTGVSGSGKSSLVSKTLLPAIAREIGQRTGKPGDYKKITGCQQIDKLVEITQAPIGRSPRSTPATYCGVFDLIRTVWANTKESKQRGFTLSRFSFNAGAGRCAQCKGQGQEKIEMNFLPDLYVGCVGCGGRRFNRQTLRVKFKGLSIADVLGLTVDEAVEFFENFSKIHRLLCTLQSVGLGYLTLGQSSVTLSGGESQRIKLATELAKPETGQTVYFLDEPTTGLHFEDVRRLVGVLDGLVERGNSVVVIEHNLDVIRSCDWLIDVGPDGGQAGGEIVATGSPADVAKHPGSITGQFI